RLGRPSAALHSGLDGGRATRRFGPRPARFRGASRLRRDDRRAAPQLAAPRRFLRRLLRRAGVGMWEPTAPPRGCGTRYGRLLARRQAAPAAPARRSGGRRRRRDRRTTQRQRTVLRIPNDRDVAGSRPLRPLQRAALAMTTRVLVLFVCA